MQKITNISNNKAALKSLYIIAIILGVILASILAIRHSISQGGDGVKSLSFSETCDVMVQLESGYRQNIALTNGVVSKNCPVSYVISNDGQYASFDINLITKDLNQKSISNNSTFVYLAATKNWVIVYPHGASEATKINFDQNDNLTINVKYEGQDIEPYIVNASDYTKLFNDEASQAIQTINSRADVKSWLSLFKGQDYTNTKTNSKAVVSIDSYDGDQIIIHAYEMFNEDGHSATFNWYKFNRLTGEVVKE